MKPVLHRLGLFLLVLAILPASACSYFGLGTKEPEPQAPQSRYLDFQDVEVPNGLVRDKDTSFIYETGNLRAGVLGLKGDVELDPTLNQFDQNMARDGWTKLSSFKYHKNILIFTKPEKVCLIIASYPYSDRTMRLEVWVSPVGNGQLAGAPYSAPAASSPPPLEENISDPNESSS